VSIKNLARRDDDNEADDSTACRHTHTHVGATQVLLGRARPDHPRSCQSIKNPGRRVFQSLERSNKSPQSLQVRFNEIKLYFFDEQWCTSKLGRT